MDIGDTDWNNHIALQQVTTLWVDSEAEGAGQNMTLEGAVAAANSGAFGHLELDVDADSDSNDDEETAEVAGEKGVLFSSPKGETLRKYFVQQQMHFLKTVNDTTIKLTVESKAEKKATDKTLQGDESMYTPEMIAARQKLKEHPDIKRIIKSLWALMPKVKVEPSAMMMQSAIGHSFDLDADGKVDTSKAFRKTRQPTDNEKDGAPGSVKTMDLGKLPASTLPAGSLTPPENGQAVPVINKNIYFALCARLFKRLVKSGTHRECFASLDAEWRNDSINDEFVNFPRFSSTIFDTIDVWCPSVDVKQYEAFVDKVLKPVAIEVCVLDPNHKFKLSSVYPELARSEKKEQARLAALGGSNSKTGGQETEEDRKKFTWSQRTQELAKPKSDLHDYSRESHLSSEKDAGVVAKGPGTPPMTAITTIAESGVAIGREATPPVPPSERQAKSVVPPRTRAELGVSSRKHEQQPPELTVLSYGAPPSSGDEVVHQPQADRALRYITDANDGKRVPSTKLGYLPADGVSVLIASDPSKVDALEKQLAALGNDEGVLDAAKVLDVLRTTGTGSVAHLTEQVALAVGQTDRQTAELRVFIPSSTVGDGGFDETAPLPALPQLMCSVSFNLRSTEPPEARSGRSSQQRSGSGSRSSSASKSKSSNSNTAVRVINLCLFDGQRDETRAAIAAAAPSHVPIVMETNQDSARPSGAVDVEAAAKVLTSLFTTNAVPPAPPPAATADPDLESAPPTLRTEGHAEAVDALQVLSEEAEAEMHDHKLDYYEPTVNARSAGGQLTVVGEDPLDPHADRFALVYPAPTVAIAHKAAIGRKLTVHRPWQEPKVGVPVPPRPQPKMTFTHKTVPSAMIATAKKLRSRELPPVVAVSNIASEVTLDEHTAAHLRMSVPQHSAIASHGQGKRIICVDDVHRVQAPPERITIMGATKPIAAVSASRSFNFTVYEPYDAAHLVHKITNTQESVVKRYLHKRVDPVVPSPKAETPRGNSCGMLESVIVEQSRHAIRSPNTSPVQRHRAIQALATGARQGVLDVTRGLEDTDVSARTVELPHTTSARLGKLSEGPSEATVCLQQMVAESEKVPFDERMALDEAAALAEALARKHAKEKGAQQPHQQPSVRRPHQPASDNNSASPKPAAPPSFSLAPQAFAAPPPSHVPRASFNRGELNVNKHNAMSAAMFREIPHSQSADAYLTRRMQMLLAGEAESVLTPRAETQDMNISTSFDPREWTQASPRAAVPSSDRVPPLAFSRKPVVYID